jgi:AcrR family transcriptional regulator
MDRVGVVRIRSVPSQSERRAATTRAIVGAARTLFTERGFDKTSVDDIAGRSGVTKGSVYHYFDTKEALFRVVFDEAERALAERMVKAAAVASSPVEGLRMAAQTFLRSSTAPAIRRIVLVDGPPVLGWNVWNEIGERHFFALFRAELVDVIPGGRERGDRDADTVAHLLVAVLNESALLVARATRPRRRLQSVLAETDRYITALSAD